MIKQQVISAGQNGFVLMFVLVICVISIIIGAGLLVLDYNSRMLGIRSGTDIAARAAGDAAVADAVFQMNEKLKVKPWNDSSFPTASNTSLPGSDATYNYAVSKTDGVYNVTATGRASRSARTVNCSLRLYSPFDYAVFTRGNLELKSNTTIDWYNNQPDDWPLQAGTASTADGAISILNGATVNGDVLVGAGGDPASVISSSGTVTITGNTYPMMSNPELPSITVPDWLASMPDGGVIKKASAFTTGKYSGITLGTNDSIIVSTPIVLYITGDITLGNGATIDVNGPNASLTIYLEGNLEGKYASGFNNFTLDSKRLYIYCLDTCTSITLKNSADFRGAIYAPNATVDLDNSGNIYGSIVSSSFILRNAANVYYDAALRDRTVSDEAVRFMIHRWSEN